MEIKEVSIQTSPCHFERFIQIDGKTVENATVILMLLKRIEKLEELLDARG